jgi:hypothetical protein
MGIWLTLFAFLRRTEGDTLVADSERENAGLNVTCASRVFLLESVVHHSLEIQGASRRRSVTVPARLIHTYSYRTHRSHGPEPAHRG